VRGYTKEAEALLVAMATVWATDHGIVDREKCARAFLDAMKGELECPECHGKEWVRAAGSGYVPCKKCKAPPEPKAVPCPDGDACPDARRYGAIHPEPKAEERTVEARLERWIRIAESCGQLIAIPEQIQDILAAHRAEVRGIKRSHDHTIENLNELQRRIDAAKTWAENESGRSGVGGLLSILEGRDNQEAR
jgi:ribosomal protein L37AE/L43A